MFAFVRASATTSAAIQFLNSSAPIWDHALQPPPRISRKLFKFYNGGKPVQGCDRFSSVKSCPSRLSTGKILLPPSRSPRIEIEAAKGRLFQIVMVVAQQCDLSKGMIVSMGESDPSIFRRGDIDDLHLRVQH